METLLIAGVDSVAGANIAAALSDRFRVVGLSFSAPVSIAGCETEVCRNQESETIRRWLAIHRPDWIIHCGPAAHSTWQFDRPTLNEATAAASGTNWAKAARESGCALTVVSSDAVFTGPWMFHREEGTCLCPSVEAMAVRALERSVLETLPSALVVRTNAYGWTAEGNGPGFLESLIRGLEMAAPRAVDHLRHATPILATDLAEFILQARRAGAKGLLHLAGGERVNPARFMTELADEFGLPAPRLASTRALSSRPEGFGCGETSLHTGAARELIGSAMPALTDGLRRLHDQITNGHRDRFRSFATMVREKVA